MDGYSRAKPLYFFVLRTGPKPAFDIRDVDNDKLLRQLIADNSSRIFRTGVAQCGRGAREVVAAISGSSLPLGCWDNPKVAADVTRELHILAINEEIPWSSYKWVDIHGHGGSVEAVGAEGGGGGGLDPATGYKYEPEAFQNRVLDTRVPVPGREIAIISEKWGVAGTDILYISLSSQPKPAQPKTPTTSRTDPAESRSHPQQQQHPATHSNGVAVRTADTASRDGDVTTGHETSIQSEHVTPAKCKPSPTAARTRSGKIQAHRTPLELEPEEALEAAELDPGYGLQGGAVPAGFGMRLSLKVPWRRREKRGDSAVGGGSAPGSCGSSITSVEEEEQRGRGGAWSSKTGSLPAIFRKRDKAPENTIQQHAVNESDRAPLCQEEKVELGKPGRFKRFRSSLTDIFRAKSKQKKSKDKV